MKFARSVLAATLLSAAALAAHAQAYPGGGGVGRHDSARGNSTSLEQRLNKPAAKAGESVAMHPMRALADALAREQQSLQLSEPVAAAYTDFVRELRDYAALDDHRTGLRLGWSTHTAHAAVDLQRDLVAQEDDAHEVAASAADLLKKWKALDQALSTEQRNRVLAIYGSMPPAKIAQ